MAKRLLFIAPEPPSDRQGRDALRMLHLLRFLGRRFQVDLIVPLPEWMEKIGPLLDGVAVEMVQLTPQRPGLLERIRHRGSYVKDKALAALVQERLATGEYGAVQVETLAMIPCVPSKMTVPLVLGVWAYGEAQPSRSLSGGTDAVGRSTHMVRLIKTGLFDKYRWPATYCTVVAADEDRIRCERGHPGRRVLVVPDGVDCRTILPRPDHTTTSPVLLFTGDMTCESHIEAALLLASDVFPAIRRDFPQAELRLVGETDPSIRRLAGSGIVVTGAVPDIRPHLRAATIYVAPHVAGSGVRMRLLEAMAGGLPIITSSIAIEGIKVQPGRDLLIADQPADMAESVHTLLTSQADRERFARAARNQAEVWYDWESCLWPLNQLYQELLTPNAVAC